MKLAVLVLAAAVSACGGVAGPNDSGAYKRLRFTPAGESVARRLPKLTAEADELFAQSEASADAGRGVEAAHLARLALWRFLAADAYAQRKGQQMRLAEVTNRQRLLDERLAAARRQERAAAEAVERRHHMAELASRIARTSEPSARPDLHSAFGRLELAYERGASRLAPADEVQAVNALILAIASAEAPGASAASTRPLLDRALLHTQRLLTDVTPRFEEETRRARVDARLEVLLERASRLPEVEARLEGRGLVLTVRQLFADGTQTIMPHRVELVDQLATLLMHSDGQSLRVEGHTEARADAQAAVATSLGRASSVRDRLVARGVSPTLLDAVGRGGADPLADNRTREGKTKNRRIEVIVLRTPPEAAEPVNRSGDPAP